MAQTVTIDEQKVCPESESLKFSATPQVENPSDTTALVTARQTGKIRASVLLGIKGAMHFYFELPLIGLWSTQRGQANTSTSLRVKILEQKHLNQV